MIAPEAAWRRLRCVFTRHVFRRQWLAYWEAWRGGRFTLYVKCARCGVVRETRLRPWSRWRPLYEWWSHWSNPNAKAGDVI